MTTLIIPAIQNALKYGQRFQLLGVQAQEDMRVFHLVDTDEQNITQPIFSIYSYAENGRLGIVAKHPNIDGPVSASINTQDKETDIVQIRELLNIVYGELEEDEHLFYTLFRRFAHWVLSEPFVLTSHAHNEVELMDKLTWIDTPIAGSFKVDYDEERRPLLIFKDEHDQDVAVSIDGQDLWVLIEQQIKLSKIDSALNDSQLCFQLIANPFVYYFNTSGVRESFNDYLLKVE